MSTDLTREPTRADRPRLLSRSVAALRDLTRPSNVIAWQCPCCRRWVPPRRFTLATGTCKHCAKPHSRTSHTWLKGAR